MSPTTATCDPNVGKREALALWTEVPGTRRSFPQAHRRFSRQSSVQTGGWPLGNRRLSPEWGLRIVRVDRLQMSRQLLPDNASSS